MPLTLLIGGVRAGKSALAVELGRRAAAEVTFIATARASDAEMRERIARHRAERPSSWTTIEEAVELATAVEQTESGRTLIVDCLTVWVSNLLLAGLSDDEIEAAGDRAAAACAQRRGTTIAVTNEVGSGVHPPTDIGRRFADVLGRTNRMWSARASDAFLVVAGRSLALHGGPG